MPGRFRNLELYQDPRHDSLPVGARSSHGVNERDYLAQADEAYHGGRFETALRLYTRCLEADRTVVRAWVGQVQMLVQLGECHEARMWSDKALELFRENGELLASRAQAFARLKDRRAALAASDAALQSPGSSSWRWQVRGEVLLAGGQPHVDVCFQKSLCERTADWFDRVVIARIYRYYSRATNALQYLKAAAEQRPDHGYVWFEMGNAQLALGLTGAAWSSFERCLELRPDDEEARKALNALSSLSPVGWLGKVLRRRIW